MNECIHDIPICDKCDRNTEKEIEALRAKIDVATRALEEIRDYVDKDPANAHAADCAFMARVAVKEIKGENGL